MGLSVKVGVHAIEHHQLEDIVRATVSNVILIESAREFTDKRCFASLTEYDGFTPVQWSETTQLTIPGTFPCCPGLCTTR